MLIQIARFEMRYLLRNPLLWATAAATFALFAAGMSVDGFDLGNEGGLLKNAAYATLRNYVVVSVFFMFVTSAFVANAVLRDAETGFGPIIRSTGITRFDYVLGRFLGAFTVAALCLLVIPLATVLGSLMPWAPQAQLGPHRLVDHLYGYFLLGLPNLFIHAAIFFALATVTRSMMAAYLGVVGFVATFFVLQSGLVGPTFDALAEPFAGGALKDAVRYWTESERNVAVPAVTGNLLYNRLLWIGVAILCLALVCATHRFAEPGISKRERKRLKLAQPDTDGSAASVVGATLPFPEHGPRALRALLWMRMRFEARQVVLSPAFIVVMAWGLFTTASVLINRGTPGRPTYPTTLTLIPNIADAFEVILLVIAIFYAGELVWRERDRRIHEIVDATPMPGWAYVVPKTLAMAVVLVAMLLVNVAAAVLFQLASGFTEVELGKYLLWYVLPTTWDVFLLAALAVFVQALSPHKTIGWAVMVVFLLWQQFNTAIDHNLLNYGTSPGMPLSDMNGAGSYWWGAWTVRIYWGAFAALLLLAAHLLWRRGTETRLGPRLAAARLRLKGRAGMVAGAAFLVFAGTGTYAFHNINVLNEYRSPLAGLTHMAQFERKYWKYHDLPQPTVEHLTVSVDLYPEQRRAVTRGRYVLRNLTTRPIDEIHLRLAYDDLELTAAAVDDARLVLDDDEFGYQIFRLDSTMQPGDAHVLTFQTQRWHRGFRNGAPNTRLVANGTFLDNYELTPVIGMGMEGTLQDPAARRYFGLPEREGRAKLEDLSATATSTHGSGGWAMSDITVSTSADQTPIAPGRRVSDVVSGGRRIARFVSEAPIRETFSVQSGHYAEKHRLHAGVDLAVYYHPAHPWNVDRMLDALAASLDYYQASFGPYPFGHVRIVEYPGYTNFAQAFAGTVPYSETYGFIADFQKPDTIDHVTGTTAHELAHQWWAHQVSGANMEGSSVLSETLANYSAIVMLSRFRGEARMRPVNRFLLDRYLAGRGVGGSEPPLIRADGEAWVAYHKGALVMSLLRERLGEDSVNGALRTLLQRYRFKHAPYPRSLDLVAALREQATTAQEQALITDLFERITLYDLAADTAQATRRADGRWDVTVWVEARKFHADAEGSQTTAPLAEPIEIGLFTAMPGSGAFDQRNVILIERRPVHSGRQEFTFVVDRKPLYAGVDPYNFYIDRKASDNVTTVKTP